MIISCSIYNDTSQTVAVPTTQYSCAIIGDTISQITIITTRSFNFTTPVVLDYNCKTPSNAFNATIELTNATQTIPRWIPLIVLVIIGGIILGLVSAFKREG